jgi:hypothetical protein
MERRSLLLMLAVVVFAYACTDAGSEGDPAFTASTSDQATSVQTTGVQTATTMLAAQPGGLVVPECDDEAMCQLGFVLDNGVFYGLECTAVADSVVTDQVLGRGELEGEVVTVNIIEGVAPTLMVAVSLPGGLCTGEPGEQPMSDWSMAFPEGTDNQALLTAICEVGELSPAQVEANGCTPGNLVLQLDLSLSPGETVTGETESAGLDLGENTLILEASESIDLLLTIEASANTVHVFDGAIDENETCNASEGGGFVCRFSWPILEAQSAGSWVYTAENRSEMASDINLTITWEDNA